jgi:hypothetical protein
LKLGSDASKAVAGESFITKGLLHAAVCDFLSGRRIAAPR